MLAGGSAIARADDAPPAPPPGDAATHGPGGEHEHHKETELDKRMDVIGKAFKKLRKQIGDASQNASSIELIASAR